MSRAHRGSMLGLQGDYTLPVNLEDNYFPFYMNKNDGRGNEPIIDTATSIESDSNFGQVLLVEEGTTNYYSNQNAFSSQGSITASYDSTTQEWTLTLPSGNSGSWRGIRYNKTDAVVPAGSYATISFEVWSTESDIPMYMDVNNAGVTTNTGINDNDVVAERVFRTTNTKAYQWVKMSVTYRIDSSASQSFYDHSVICFANNYIPSTDKVIKIRRIQLERRSTCTSFTEGSRSDGYIQYHKDIVPHRDATINMWISPTEGVPRVNNATKIISFGPGITTNRLTLWNYYPISTDAGNRRIIADFGNDGGGTRMYRDINITELFTVGTWEMFTITIEYATRVFRFYRNGRYLFSHTPAILNPIQSLEIQRSGWKYASLLLSPRVVSDKEIRNWFEYGKRFYDPYDYYAVWA